MVPLRSGSNKLTARRSRKRDVKGAGNAVELFRRSGVMPIRALRSHRNGTEFFDEPTFAFAIGRRGDIGAFTGCHSCFADLGRRDVARSSKT